MVQGPRPQRGAGAFGGGRSISRESGSTQNTRSGEAGCFAFPGRRPTVPAMKQTRDPFRTLTAHTILWTGATLSFLDASTTYVGIRSGAAEANPVIATGMNTIGLAPALMVKVVLAVLAFWFIGYRLVVRGKRWAVVSGIVGLAATAFVVGSNVLALKYLGAL